MNGETLELNFAQPVAASCPPAESIHNGGLGFLPTLPPKRRCRQCLQLLPLTEFASKGKQGRNRFCRKCYAPRKKLYKNAWRQRHRSYVNAYSKAYQQRIKQEQRPPLAPCAICGSDDIFWKGGKWNCAPCNRAAARKRGWARGNVRKKSRDVARYTEKLQQQHGKPIADAYAQLHRERPQTRVRVPLERLVMLGLRFQGRALTFNNALRVIQLNRLSNQRTDNLGWHCAKCDLFSDDFRFFDVDHITPRSKAGHGRIANLQVLCPNCHRRKTIVDVYPALPESPSCTIPPFLTDEAQMGSGTPPGTPPPPSSA